MESPVNTSDLLFQSLSNVMAAEHKKVRAAYLFELEAVCHEMAASDQSYLTTFATSPDTMKAKIEEFQNFLSDKWSLGSSVVFTLRPKNCDMPIAFVTAVECEDHVSLFSLIVQQKYREAGFATKLLKLVFANYDWQPFYGCVHKSSVIARRLYRSIGVQELDSFPYLDELKPLDVSGYLGLRFPALSPSGRIGRVFSINKHVCTEKEVSVEKKISNILQPSSVASKGRMWDRGTTITVSLMGNGPLSGARMAKIKDAVAEWQKICSGLTFKFLPANTTTANIRIAFEPSEGSWSYVGTDCLKILDGAPTMNLGWIDTVERDLDGTIKHEFGHVLGLLHEHQHPNNNINWIDDDLIYAYYYQFHGWSHTKVKENILDRYSISTTLTSQYDPNSIMHYDFSALMTGCTPKRNTELSAGDKAFVKSCYGSDNEPNKLDAIMEQLKFLVSEVENLKQAKK
jgi:hypothetical protein